MQYLIGTILIFILIDIYYRFRKIRENIFLLQFIALIVIRFEKMLLKENIIDQREIEYTRNLIREEIGDKNFQKIKNIFVAIDPDYKNILMELFGSEAIENKDETKRKVLSLKDIIFNKQYKKLKIFIRNIEKKNIEEYKQNQDKWVEDKYGKNLFNEK